MKKKNVKKKQSIPICMVCDNPIYNPAFYEFEMCGSCATGEADTLFPEY